MASVRKAVPAPGVVDRLELEARDRARILLREAEEAAAKIRAVVEEERGSALLAAAVRGREEGFAEAAASVVDLALIRQRRLEGLEQEIAAVALEVARKLLADDTAARPEVVVGLARRALEPVRDRREVLLRVNPADAPLLRSAQPALGTLLERARGLSLREDAAVARGGVIVETEAGRVDARVEAQLALLEAALARGRA